MARPTQTPFSASLLVRAIKLAPKIPPVTVDASDAMEVESQRSRAKRSVDEAI